MVPKLGPGGPPVYAGPGDPLCMLVLGTPCVCWSWGTPVYAGPGAPLCMLVLGHPCLCWSWGPPVYAGPGDLCVCWSWEKEVTFFIKRGRYGSGGKTCHLAIGGLLVRSHPGYVKVSLSKALNPQLLLTSWSVPGMAANRRWCVNVCANG